MGDGDTHRGHGHAASGAPSRGAWTPRSPALGAPPRSPSRSPNSSHRRFPCVFLRRGHPHRHLRLGGGRSVVSAELTAPVPTGRRLSPRGGACSCRGAASPACSVPGAARPSGACRWGTAPPGHGVPAQGPVAAAGGLAAAGPESAVVPGVSLLTAETRFPGRLRFQPLGLIQEPLCVLMTERLGKVNPSFPTF